VTKKSETVEYFENETFLKKMFRSKIVIVKKKIYFIDRISLALNGIAKIKTRSSWIFKMETSIF